MRQSRLLLAVVITFCTMTRSAHSQDPTPPPDRPFHTDSAAAACLDRAIQSRVAEARRTFPQARQRFIRGLPSRYSFSVTTRLRDATGNFEQVFVTVDSARGDSLIGRIASEIRFVRGYYRGQPRRLTFDDVLDWTVLRPDGSEEGNYVGKYLDSLQDRLQQGGIPKPC